MAENNVMEAQQQINDQLRDLTNVVHLAGQLTQLEIFTGKTGAGVDYIRLQGTIQCGDDPIYTRHFRAFAQATKKDGSDSKQYQNMVAWANSAVPKIKNTEEFTWVDAIGSMITSDYVAKDGSFREEFQYQISAFRDFKEYACSLDLEGIIMSVNPETKKGTEGEETGRAIIRLLSKCRPQKDASNIIDFKFYAPEDFADQLEENDYVRGNTATFFIDFIATEETAPQPKGGLGKQRNTTNGNRTLEPIMTGCNEALIAGENDKAIDPKTAKLAMGVRNEILTEKKNEGYKGGTKKEAPKATASSSTGTTAKAGLGNTRKKMEVVDDDGEWPF